jgi:two-component system chemotaxis response regulator CheB
MPVMNGVEALPLLLRRRPGIRVIVVSTLSQRNAEITLKCLSLGATDYLPKPAGHRQVTTSADFRRELFDKLRGLSFPRARSPRPLLTLAPTELRTSSPPRCLLIGASTGGPRAIEEVLAGLGGALRKVPVLVVQHMPPTFTGVFAEHLSAQLGVRAREPQDGEELVDGMVYVAPGGRHMGLAGGASNPSIRLSDDPPVNFCRPAVDVLFRDAASIIGAGALAVVLTGMGSDGTRGARLLVESGATVLAQDEATSTVWGMPGSVARAGLAQSILPLGAIGPTIGNYIAGASA